MVAMAINMEAMVVVAVAMARVAGIKDMKDSEVNTFNFDFALFLKCSALWCFNF